MTDTWVRDTGLVLSFIAVICSYRGVPGALLVAGALILVTLLAPSLLRPIAHLWFNLSKILGSIMPRVFFGLVFYLVVTPIGFARRMITGDQRSRTHTQKKTSAFIKMKGLITPEDLVHPY